MASGVEVEKGDAKRLAATHLRDEGCAGFCQSLLIWMTEVDQITVMREDLRGGVSFLSAVPAECLDLRRRQGF